MHYISVDHEHGLECSESDHCCVKIFLDLVIPVPFPFKDIIQITILNGSYNAS
jgi:hypothetical protein